MKDSKRKCWKCGSTSAYPDVVLYRFPKPGVKNVLRCELWAKFFLPCGPWASTEFQNKLYSEHRMLCSKHFEPASFIDFPLKKLHRHAVPCDISYEVSTVDQPGPSRILMDTTNTTAESKSVSAFSESGQLTGADKENHPVTAETSLHDPTNKEIVTVDNIEHYPMTSGSSQPQFHETTRLTEALNKRFNKYDTTHALQSEKARDSYAKCRKYLKRICQLRSVVKRMKNNNYRRLLDEDDAIKSLEKKISPTFAILLQGEVKNFPRKPKGRRWTTENKMIALRLYNRSPTCYRLLMRLFCLPSPSALKKMLGLFNMTPGTNEKVLKILIKDIRGHKPSDNEFVLMFDEMSIKKHLNYNRKEDKIEGFQDHGNHGRAPQEAVKALVFMIAGIRRRIKQSLAYYLSSANVTADRLMVLIKETLRDCFKFGIGISATVCDMGGTNRRALTSLGATEERPVINIDGKDVITLFDAPHLLKCFRNMFMKYDIKCKTNISSSDKSGKGLAKWSDIQLFYELDSSNPNFVFAPSLKKEHLEPNTKQKMKVNLAAQVLSHTVAAGMFTKVAEGKLPASAAITADVLSKMDKLFDLVNSDTPDRRRGKPHATNISKTSPHLKYFREIKLFLKSLIFVGSPRSPPSLEGWIWTINGLEMLWASMQKYNDVKSLATRRLQQDPLENLFGTIRGNCGSNTNPTTGAFIGGMKTAIMSNLTHISSGNCEVDSNIAIIDNFKMLLSSSARICTEEESQLMPLFQSSVDSKNLEEVVSEDNGEMQACAYVCGFLMKNMKHFAHCTECKNIFHTQTNSYVHNFVENKEYNELKKSLHYASDQFIECVEKCAFVFNSMLTEDASRNNIKHTMLNNINDETFDFLKNCAIHIEENKKYIKHSVFYISVKRFCTLQNRKYAEEASRSALKKKIDTLKNL